MESFSSFRFMTLLILTHTMFFNFKPVGVVHVPQDLYTIPGNSSDLYTPSRNSSVSPPPPPLLFPFPIPPPPPLPPSPVPALFVIGDSSVDCGTNNFLGTFARADRLPYGRDFDSHQPTGRFSNGRIPVDYLALHLGLPFVPSFLGQSGSVNDMKRGLNYASAGAGIIFSSGSELGQHISFTQQIQQVMDTFQRFILTMGEDAAASLITNSIFYISIGTNDYIHYYLPNVSDVQSKYVSWKFTQFLAQSMKQEIKVVLHLTYTGTEIVINAIKIVTFCPTQKKWNKMGHGFALDLSSVQNDNLYNAKVRRVIVMGLAPIGCAPYYLWQYNSTNGECVKEINNMIMEFNFVLRYTVEELRKELKDANIIFCDAYLGSMDIMTKFDEYGFSVTKSACCGLGRYNGWIMCISPGMACENASNHLWWDQFHPTSAVNEILAENVWSGLHTKMCYPMNMEDMVAQRVSTHG